MKSMSQMSSAIYILKGLLYAQLVLCRNEYFTNKPWITLMVKLTHLKCNKKVVNSKILFITSRQCLII